MAYSTLSDSQIDADSPLIADTLFKLRDNPEAIALGLSGATRIVAGALAAGAALGNIGAGGIAQGYLNTSLGEVSINGDSTGGTGALTLPGGQYGFYPQTKHGGAAGANSWEIYINGGTLETTYITEIYFKHSDTDAWTPDPYGYAQQRYINSSPPYNIGDGDVPLFVFALVNSSGVIEATYAADVPPWAYNGPTRVTADRIAADGRKFQNRRFIDPRTGNLIRDEIEITHEIKNADMALIPHPFFGNDLTGKTVVLLDPVETLDLLDLHEMGESVADMLYGRHLVVDSDRIARACPAGVQACAIKWKQAQKKWRALPSVAARMEIAPGIK